MKEVQRRDDFSVREVADVKHTHEVIGANLPHLLIEFTGHRVRASGQNIARLDQVIPA